MRLKEAHVKQICHAVIVSLREKKLMTLKKGENEVLNRMVSIFLNELRIEDEINKEALAILEKNAAKMGDNIDREKMFQLIKKQLVRDKKVIL